MQIYQISSIWNNLDKIKKGSASGTPPLHLHKPIRLTIFVYESDLERFMENNRWTNPKSPLSHLQCKAFHLNGVQTRLKCKPNVKRCKRFVFPSHSPLLHHNALTAKAISHFQADHILTRFVFPPLNNRFLLLDFSFCKKIGGCLTQLKLADSSRFIFLWYV